MRKSEEEQERREKGTGWVSSRNRKSRRVREAAI